MRPAVIWDFHGTLADVTPVLPLLREKDYEGFYEGSLSCPAIESTVLSARQTHDAGYVNILMTGMPERYGQGLGRWLTGNGVPIDRTFMRTEEDGFRKDFVIKRRMYLEAVDLGYCIMRAWEDSPAVIDLWNRQGIPVVPMPRLAIPGSTDQVDNQQSSS